jgi:hypothetical protein
MDKVEYELARHVMWHRLGCYDKEARRSWAYPDKPHQVEPEQEDYEKAREKMNFHEAKLALEKATLSHEDYCNKYIYPPAVEQENIYLDTLPVSNYNNTKEHSMNYAQAVVQSPVYTDTAKDYIVRRLYDAKYEHSRAIEKHFQPYGKFPKTLKELKVMLKAGDYRLIEHYRSSSESDEDFDYDEDEDCFHWTEALKWGKEKPDNKAYQAACKALSDKYDEVLDIVSIITDEDKRLEALQNFRSATFH